ncbi:hypothetical protein HOB10_04920 [Candidatus Parcubacteria bacterium]|jgi:hypothetical protein|nr:hypothetical protein [Candidatus Parcubacteria bacterium]
MPKTVFSVTVGLEEKGAHSNFPAAFKQFWATIMDILDQGTSWQMLETTNFLVMFTEDGQRIPLDFYDARDLAFDIGLMQEVKDSRPNMLEQPTLENWEEYVTDRYQRVPDEMMRALQMDLLDNLGALLKVLDEAVALGDDIDEEARVSLSDMKDAATGIKDATTAGMRSVDTDVSQPPAPQEG